MMICHPPGAGKTRIAIEAAKALKATNILVICPALARPVWIAEFAKWSSLQATPVTVGRDRKHMTRAQKEAYEAPIRVASYGLVEHLYAVSDPLQDLVIFDEIHNLRSPHTSVSRHARKLMAANPGCAAMGLTATPIPTKTEQVWHPMELLFPGWAGKRRNAIFDIPWGFLTRYCERVENEYGVSYTGPKSDEAMEQLRAHMRPYVRRVEPETIEKYLPAIDAAPLYVDNYRLDWANEFVVDALGENVRHIAIIAYKRETAQLLYANLSRRFSALFAKEGRGVYHFTGHYAPEARATTLQHFQKHGGVLVCTSESIRESIDMSFCKSVLITEWRTSPAQALQLLGRFRRPNGDARINRVRYLTTSDDVQRAALLKQRLDALSIVLEADSSQSKLQEIFTAKTVSDADLEAMFDSLVVSDAQPEEKEAWSCQN